MEGEGNGIKDEFFTLYLGTKEDQYDNYGRNIGSYLMATKGIMNFDGPGVPRETFKWNHVCSSVVYNEERADRYIVANGEYNFNISSDYFRSSSWPEGHNFTIGGREIFYYGEHLNGFITDVQIFSRSLTNKEMIDFTSCQNVRFLFKELFRNKY